MVICKHAIPKHHIIRSNLIGGTLVHQLNVG